MRLAGADRNLPALPGTRLDTERLQGDGQQTGRHLFAGRDHGIVFARVMHRRGVAAPCHQFVGFAGHRRDHHGDVVAGIDLAFDVAGDILDAFDIGDRRAAEFHDEPAHDGWCIP